MTWLHHKGCHSPVVEYVGIFPVYAVPSMRRQDWRDLDGREFIGARIPALVCPDCGESIRLHSDYLATFNDTPTAFGLPIHAKPKDEPKRRELTGWLWFKQKIT